MNYKYEYKTEEERQSILSNNADKFLIEEQNISEGNFLIFSDIQPPQPEVKVLIKEEDLNEIKQNQTLMQQAIDDLILGGVL